MLQKTALVLLLAGTFGLAACAHPPTQEQAGMVIGGTLGGLLGAQVGGGRGQTAAIIAGTLAGAAIGGSVGRSMDEVDRMKTARTLETVRTGVSSQWVNPDTGHHYTVVPTSTYDTPSGPCREYTIEALIGGQTETVYGTACRQPDGSWRVVE